MSLQARQALVHSPYTIFRTQLQRDDLLDPTKTSTNLIAFLLEMVGKKHYIEFTAIHSDHHDDSGLSPVPPHSGTHQGGAYGGYGSDVWFNAGEQLGAFLDPQDPRFQEALRDAAVSPWSKQIGLAGDAANVIDEIAAGANWFPDSGASHVHLGVHA